MLARVRHEGRAPKQTLALLEVVTIISLTHPAEKPGAEPGKRNCLNKAENCLDTGW